MLTVLSLFPKEVSSDMSMSEKLSSILSTAIVGFLVVFAVLAVIWGILEIFGKVFGKNKAEDGEKSDAGPQEEESLPPDVQENGDEETVAAIMAAVAAYTDRPVTSFRVVSFKKAKRHKK